LAAPSRPKEVGFEMFHGQKVEFDEAFTIK
jgi:hypothetical protein